MPVTEQQEAFQPRERAAYVARRLSGWANQMVCRYGEGTHVYLVGSYLTSDTPRDLDISIVVPDALFWRRYRDGADVDRLAAANQAYREMTGNDAPPYPEDWNVHGEWGPDMLRFGREWASLTRGFFLAWSHLGTAGGAWPVDLKIMALSEMEARHKNAHRLQLDTIPVKAKSEHRDAEPVPT